MRNDRTPLRVNIQNAKHEFALKDEEFGEVNIANWGKIEKNIEKNFLLSESSITSSTWLWEQIKSETYVVSCDHDPYDKLNLLINENEQVYFFVDETINEGTQYWCYEGKVKAIMNIIGNTDGIEEYYLASKKYDWFLCVNHHQLLIASGSIIPKIKHEKGKIKS